MMLHSDMAQYSQISKLRPYPTQEICLISKVNGTESQLLLSMDPYLMDPAISMKRALDALFVIQLMAQSSEEIKYWFSQNSHHAQFSAASTYRFLQQVCHTLHKPRLFIIAYDPPFERCQVTLSLAKWMRNTDRRSHEGFFSKGKILRFIFSGLICSSITAL